MFSLIIKAEIVFELINTNYILKHILTYSVLLSNTSVKAINDSYRHHHHYYIGKQEKLAAISIANETDFISGPIKYFFFFAFFYFFWFLIDINRDNLYLISIKKKKEERNQEKNTLGIVIKLWS